MPTQPDALAVREANLAFYAAFEQLDLEAMGAIWADDDSVSCIHPGWDPLVGRAAILEAWRGIFRGTKAIRFLLRDPSVLVVRETAWVVLVEDIEAHHPNGTVQASALATNVFVKGPTGWRMVHHHASPILTTDEDKKPAGGTVLH